MRIEREGCDIVMRAWGSNTIGAHVNLDAWLSAGMICIALLLAAQGPARVSFMVASAESRGCHL